MFVSLEGRSCLVVGAGQVGLRKIETLAECRAASVLVVDQNPPDEGLSALLTRPGLCSSLHFVQRDFQDSDLDGVFLAIASTSSPTVNQRISDLCRQRGVLCNIVDQPEACTFIVPATVRQGDLTLAISTGGQSPALAKALRKDLQKAYGPEYALFLDLMGRLRPLVLGLGLDEFSMSAVSVPDVKRTIRSISYEEAASVAAEALKLCSHQETEAFLAFRLADRVSRGA